jgi:hypothetical protein
LCRPASPRLANDPSTKTRGQPARGSSDWTKPGTALDTRETRRYFRIPVRVVQRGRIRIYVYQEVGHRHHLAHCHLYWPGGACVVGLDQFEVLAGVDPPVAAWELLREYLVEVKLAWKQLNPERASR